LSFFPIEVFTWILLDVRLQPSKAELEAESFEIVKLMSVLNPYRKQKFKRTYSSLLLPESWSGVCFWLFTCFELIIVAAMIFWPISIIISMFEFKTWEKGQWIFWCFALVLWLVALAGGVLVIFILAFTVDAVARQKGNLIKWTIRQFEGVSPASVYVGLKMFVILREYLMRYTGAGTRKPDWLDWLN
jgi:hypothetical protein